MHGSLGGDIKERIKVIVLVKFFRWDFACGDFTEKTIGHRTSKVKDNLSKGSIL
jgi:hypothetical protein